MPQLRSATSTTGRNMAGARALWRATGMKSEDFGKPIIAIANSFTQFVPCHFHLQDMGPPVTFSYTPLQLPTNREGFVSSVPRFL